MFNIIKKTLESLLNNEDGELRNNPAAWQLFNLIKVQGFNPDKLSKEQLLTHLLIKGSDSVSIINENTGCSIDDRGDDRRIIRLLVSGVKKFPYEDGMFYGLDFYKNYKPISAVFLGNNGIGKTSFYAALEYIILGNAFTAVIRDESLDDFLTNVKNVRSEANFRLEYGNGKEKSIKGISAVNELAVPAFFCSEWDVREVEKRNNITNYIIQQVGFTPFYRLLHLLDETIGQEASYFRQGSKAQEEIIELQVNSVMPRFAALNRFSATDMLLDVESAIGKGLEVADISNGSIESLKVSIGINKSLIEKEKAEWDGILSDLPYDIYSEVLNILDELSVACKNASTGRTNIIYLVNEYNRERETLIQNRKKIAVKIRKHENISSNENRGLLVKDLVAISKKKDQMTALPVRHMALQNHQRWVEQVVSLRDTLYFKFNELMREKVYQPIKLAFSELLNPHLKDDGVEIRTDYVDITVEDGKNEGVKEEVKQECIRIRLKYIDQNIKVEPFFPSRFLNTFRFKLFTVALKISLACAAKIIYNENWPILIDDIFDSSDFNNRTYINRFIENIVEGHNSLMRQNSKNYPLQLIFFTQDDVIGTSVYKGLDNKNEPAQLYRIYDYESFTTKEIKIENKDGVDESILIVGEILKTNC